jgi:hypothetical protein
MTDVRIDDAKEAKPKRGRLTLEQKLAQLDVQKARLLAQKQKVDRRRDARAKIVFGATIMKAMANDPDLAARIVPLLEANVQRPQDREAIAPWLPRTSTSL